VAENRSEVERFVRAARETFISGLVLPTDAGELKRGRPICSDRCGWRIGH
jgi:hypothetical protein